MRLYEANHCNGILLYCIMSWSENKGVTLSLFIHYMQRVQGHSSIIQHAQNHENITFDICNIDYKIWTNSEGHLKVLKFQYLQAMQINRLFSIEIVPQESNKCTPNPITYSTTTWEKRPSIWPIKMFFQSLQTLLFTINFYYSDTLQR